MEFGWDSGGFRLDFCGIPRISVLFSPLFSPNFTPISADHPPLDVGAMLQFSELRVRANWQFQVLAVGLGHPFDVLIESYDVTTGPEGRSDDEMSGPLDGLLD